LPPALNPAPDRPIGAGRAHPTAEPDKAAHDDVADDGDDGRPDSPRPPWLSAAVSVAVLGLLLLLGWWAVAHG